MMHHRAKRGAQVIAIIVHQVIDIESRLAACLNGYSYRRRDMRLLDKPSEESILDRLLKELAFCKEA